MRACVQDRRCYSRESLKLKVNTNTMSNTQNTEFLEAQQGDFDEFLAKRNWIQASAIISNLYDTGFDHEAVILRKSLLNAQNAYLDSFVPCPDCPENPGTIYLEVEDSYYSKECPTCEGTGTVAPTTMEEALEELLEKLHDLHEELEETLDTLKEIVEDVEDLV